MATRRTPLERNALRRRGGKNRSYVEPRAREREQSTDIDCRFWFSHGKDAKVVGRLLFVLFSLSRAQFSHSADGGKRRTNVVKVGRSRAQKSSFCRRLEQVRDVRETMQTSKEARQRACSRLVYYQLWIVFSQIPLTGLRFFIFIFGSFQIFFLFFFLTFGTVIFALFYPTIYLRCMHAQQRRTIQVAQVN